MKTWFIADTHFDCPRLVENTRTWTTPEEHDELVLDAINTRVKRTDRLIIAGDFCKSRPFKWRQRVVCRDIWLVLGNHCKVGLSEQCFGRDRVKLAHMAKLDSGDHVYCSHYPHAAWPRSHYGTFHVYGHCHSKIEPDMDEWMPKRRSMDVGVDNAVKVFGSVQPFEDTYLIETLGAKEGHGIVKPEDRWNLRDYSGEEA